MALSDQLTDLAARAKQLEDRAAAAKAKNKADLQQDVKRARDAADAQGEALHNSAERNKDTLSAWWVNVQDSWSDHLDHIRTSIDDKMAEHDLKSAQKAAARADDDASFAIDYAYAAIEEAEYAVLDADLAHAEVDELAQASVNV
jgi:hypothetical protein